MIIWEVIGVPCHDAFDWAVHAVVAVIGILSLTFAHILEKAVAACHAMSISI